MEISQLRLFRTVVEAGSLSQAAALMHMTPGAASKGLRRFEAQIGRVLFSRASRTLSLTDAGRQLYQRSATLMAEHARLTAELETLAPTHSRALRIASFEVFTTHCLPPVLERLPDREVQVLDVGVGAIEEAVREREVDYGITYVPFPHRELHYEPVSTIRFGIWGHPRFEGTPFDELPFGIPVTRLQLAAGELLGIDCWPYQRVARRVLYRLTTLESALALARAARSVVFLPDFIGALHNRSVRRGLRLKRFASPAGLGTVSQTVRLVVRNERRDDPGVSTLRRAYAAAIASA